MCQCEFLLSSVILFLLTLSVYDVTSFNVDSFNYAIYGGPTSSMFGFSMAVHKEGNSGWLIVGAPEAQSSYQRGVIRGGAVYKCPTDRDGNCQEIPFDTKDDNYEADGTRMDNKTEQWFGATVSAALRENSPIVACAPRYTWFPRNRRRDPVGTCYVSNEYLTDFNEYAPCRTYHWGYHRQGSCQAGFSAAINRDGDRLFIGAPGSWYWQGQMYSVDAHAKFEYKPLLFAGAYGSPGQVHVQSLETRPAVFSTTEGREKDDDSYMGYSIITGDFLGNGEDSIAVGMPRGNDLKGRVLLFTWNLTNFLHHLTSDQIGSYFGYALATSDVDGDNKIDLIVGAPMYTLPNNEGKYDVGRVYVIYHESSLGKFVASYEIDGFNSKSRFGQAVSSLGDINQDGYGDFAVGAPYDGPNGQGAVYIYHGSSKGVRKKYSQVIYAEDVIKGPLIQTFGFSITGGLDLDGNEYPDMAVGAYLSSNAFFFRSRPVVRIHADVRFLAHKKEIDIKIPNYVLKSGGRAVTTQIEFCLRYHGKGIPHYIDLNLQYILDAKKSQNPRMGFVEAENLHILNDTIRIYKDRNDTCKRRDVFVKSEVRDKLTPLLGELKYWMQDESLALTRNPRSELRPVLDQNLPPASDSITIHKECGDDGVCIPNLNINVTSNVNEYLIGSKEPLTFDILVSNFGEDSYESTLEVKYPENVYYSKIEEIKVESPITCNTYENNTLKCEIGNPIPKDKVVRFKIRWQPDYKEGMSPTYDFILRVNSTNQENSYTLQDNVFHKSVKVWSDFRLEIAGKSQPAEAYVNESLYTADISNQNVNTDFEDRLREEVIGPQVTHIYYLRNNGPTPIRETEVYFVWPALTLGGEDLLYLLEEPHFSNNENVQCDPMPTNYRGFNFIRDDRSIWERLHIDVIGSDSNTFNPSGDKINATIGGGSTQIDETLDKKVGTSGDSSNVHEHRHNKSTSEGGGHGGTINTGGNTHVIPTVRPTPGSGYPIIEHKESTFTNSSGTYKVDKFGYVTKISSSTTSTSTSLSSGNYRCYDLINQQLHSIPCEVGTTYRAYRSTGANEDYKLIHQCYDSNYGGDRYPVNCGSSFQYEGIIFTFYQSFNITRIENLVTTSEKCYDYMDGQKLEVDCGPGLKLQNAVYKCFDQINGQLTEIPCISGYTYRQYQQQGQNQINLVRGCFQISDQGLRQEIACGAEFLRRNILYRFHQSTSMEGATHFVYGNISYYCFEEIDNEIREMPCQSGATYKYNRRSLMSAGGIDLILGCFITYNGRRKEIGCGPSYQRQDFTINFSFEGSGSGGSSSSSSSSGSTSEHIVNIVNRCYDKINGVDKQVECTPEYLQSRVPGAGNVTIHQRCFDIVNGRKVEIPCIPGGSLPPSGLQTNTFIMGSEIVSYRCYEHAQSGAKEVPCNADEFRAGKITFKCFKQVKGGLRPVVCSPADVFQTSYTGSGSVGNVHHQSSSSSQSHAGTWSQSGTGNYHHSGHQSSSSGSESSYHGSASIGGATGYHGSASSGGESGYHGSASSGGATSYHGSASSGGATGYHGSASSGSATGFHQTGGSSYHSGGSASTVQQGGQSHYQGQAGHYGSNTLYGYHQQGSAGASQGTHYQGGSQDNTNVYSDEYEYEDEDEEEEEEEEEDGNKAISTVYNTNSNLGAPGSVSNTGIQQGSHYSGPKRDPSTYGKNYQGLSEVLGGNVGDAALNRGFTATAVDLSDIGTRQQSNSNNNNNYGRGYSSSSSYERHWSETGPLVPIGDNAADRDNVPTDRPSNNRYYGRKKRAVADSEVLKAVRKKFPCNSVQCLYLSCRIGTLRADDVITIALRSRFNARILKNVTTSQPIKLSSVMVARVSKLPFVSTIPHDEGLDFHEVHTTVPVSPKEDKVDMVPLWVVVLSAVAGTVILLLLIFLLYKLGFFKRNRPSNAPERQPLNRNGYHHGDEAL